MLPYRIASVAQTELERILLERAKASGWESSMALEDQLQDVFEGLGRGLLVGHRRFDLTPKNLLFFYSRPYMVLYRGNDLPIEIVMVVHGARNLKRILRRVK